jgi:GNAT superfamily N-acetyltransferase
MRARPNGAVPESPLRLRRIENPDVDHYRDLFRLVGAPWLWFSRLILDDSKLANIITDPQVLLCSVIDARGREVGLLELDFRNRGECELAFVGLATELAGKGHGKWLLSEAVQLAWRDDVERVHVHTCSLDHPAALAAYRRIGFRAYRRAIERFPDPRLLGILPRGSAPQIPIIID